MSDWTIEGRFRGQRVALLWGGLSNEREVSGWSADAIEVALRERGYDVARIDAGRDLPTALAEARPAVAFIALHGTYGEDGRLQGMLDWLGLPYTGDGIEASVLAMNKALAKAQYRAHGLPVVEDALWRERAGRGAAELPFALPAVVKPIAEGSSVGVHFAEDEAGFAAALEATATHPAVLIEKKIAGPELSVACLGDTLLGCVEIEPTRGFYDYAAKYLGEGTRYHLPPRLPVEVAERAAALGFAAHRALGCQGLTRTDLLVGPDGPVILETNTLPGMTPSSLVPKIAGHLGISFADLIELQLDRAACARELIS